MSNPFAFLSLGFLPDGEGLGREASRPFLAAHTDLGTGKQLAARLIGRVLPTDTITGGLRHEHLTHQPDKLAERRIETLCHDDASARWFV